MPQLVDCLLSMIWGRWCRPTVSTGEMEAEKKKKEKFKASLQLNTKLEASHGT